MELDSRRNHEDVGRPECAPSFSATNSGVARTLARGPRISELSLQIGTSASSLRIRVRRFDSCRGHLAVHAESTDARLVMRVAWSSAERAFVRSRPLETA